MQKIAWVLLSIGLVASCGGSGPSPDKPGSGTGEAQPSREDQLTAIGDGVVQLFDDLIAAAEANLKDCDAMAVAFRATTEKHKQTIEDANAITDRREQEWLGNTYKSQLAQRQPTFTEKVLPCAGHKGVTDAMGIFPK